MIHTPSLLGKLLNFELFFRKTIEFWDFMALILEFLQILIVN